MGRADQLPLPEAPALAPAHDGRGPLGRGLVVAALIFVATRLVVWTAAYAGAFIGMRISQGLEPPLEQHRQWLALARAEPEGPLAKALGSAVGGFAPLLRWDAGHYASIVDEGYGYTPPVPGTPPADAQSNIAFFPLYPLLCTALAPLVGVSGAMVLVANVAALLAALLIYVWLRGRGDDALALGSVALVFCWPPACFYSFGYAESVMLLLVVGALLLADRGRFWSAALACGAATACRPSAAMLAVVLMLACWLEAGGARWRRLRKMVGVGLVGAMGLLAYVGYLTYRFGSPQVYLDNFRSGWVPGMRGDDWLSLALLSRIWDQFKYFGRAFSALPASLVILTDPRTWNMPATLVIVGLSLWGLFRTPRRFKPYLLLGPLIFLERYLAAGWSSLGVESLARYTMLAVPALVVLAAWAAKRWSPAARTVLIATLLLLEATWAFQFGLGEWAG